MMHTLHIRNINDDLYEKLKQSSQFAHRSMSRHIQVLLRDALDASANELVKRRRILHDMEAYRNQLDLETI